MTPSSRVREFPDEHLKVSAGVLFCGVCREELSTKRSIIANHITSAKHKHSKLKLDRSESREKDIAEALAKYDKQEHPACLPNKSSCCLSKGRSAIGQDSRYPRGTCLPTFRQERNEFHLEEIEQIRREISGTPVSIIFDGTSRLGEALVIVLRFLDNWEIKQGLVQLQILVKSMTGEELAREKLVSFVESSNCPQNKCWQQ